MASQVNKANACSDCLNANARKRYAQNPEHYRKRAKSYHERNLEKERKRGAAYRKTEHGAEMCRKRCSKYSKETSKKLSDKYIKHNLRLTYGLSTAEISPELIEIKRAMMTIERQRRVAKKAPHGN